MKRHKWTVYDVLAFLLIVGLAAFCVWVMNSALVGSVR